MDTNKRIEIKEKVSKRYFRSTRKLSKPSINECNKSAQKARLSLNGDPLGIVQEIKILPDHAVNVVLVLKYKV